MALINLEHKAEPKMETLIHTTQLCFRAFIVKKDNDFTDQTKDGVLRLSKKANSTWPVLGKADSGNWFVHTLSWQHHIFHRWYRLLHAQWAMPK